MIVADEPLLKSWSPPSQPDIWSTPPTWTRFGIGGVELSNALEEMSWHKRVVYPIACEGCGMAECADEGIARVVRFGRAVLWLKPADEFADAERWRDVYGGAWRKRLTPANVIFPSAAWNRLCERYRSLRPSDELSPATNRDLIHLWFTETPLSLRGDELRVRRDEPDWLVDALRHDALAADPVDLILAANRIGRLLTHLHSAPDEPAAGKLVPIGEAPGTVESIYFDGDPFVEWTAATFDPDSLVIDGRWVWVRQPG